MDLLFFCVLDFDAPNRPGITSVDSDIALMPASGRAVKKKPSGNFPKGLLFTSRAGGSRTHTTLRSGDFKSPASAYSATAPGAYLYSIRFKAWVKS